MKTRNALVALITASIMATGAVASHAAQNPQKPELTKEQRQEKRMNRFIRQTDADGDKKVNEAELLTALTATFDVLDADHDGKLTKTELDNQRDVLKAYRQQAKADAKKPEASAEAETKPARLMPLPRKAMDKHFSMIDTDKDGSLSKTELDTVAKKVFSRRDKNKDGFISTDDLKA